MIELSFVANPPASGGGFEWVRDFRFAFFMIREYLQYGASVNEKCCNAQFLQKNVTICIL